MKKNIWKLQVHPILDWNNLVLPSSLDILMCYITLFGITIKFGIVPNLAPSMIFLEHVRYRHTTQCESFPSQMRHTFNAPYFPQVKHVSRMLPSNKGTGRRAREWKALWVWWGICHGWGVTSILPLLESSFLYRSATITPRFDFFWKQRPDIRHVISTALCSLLHIFLKCCIHFSVGFCLFFK